jgi:hypothetical protein
MSNVFTAVKLPGCYKVDYFRHSRTSTERLIKSLHPTVNLPVGLNARNNSRTAEVICMKFSTDGLY